MSKKKPEKSKKRSKAILKGVVTAGAVIGGVDVFSNANVVYAAELDENGMLKDTEVVVETSIAEEAASALETQESDAPSESTNDGGEGNSQENNDVNDTVENNEEDRKSVV